MRTTAVAVLMSICAWSASAQDGLTLGTITIEGSCGYVEELQPDTILLFQSNTEADETIGRIVASTGLRKNFKIAAGAVPNAAAMIQPPSTRFIVYSPEFMVNVRQSTGNQWAPISILAHEIGHHLQGHTLEQGGSRPDIELEADEYSGFVLQRMGATLADAKIAMETLGSESGSATHPARRDRLVAIARGWSEACHQTKCDQRTVPRDPGGASPDPKPEPVVKPTCPYTDDGQCDEPDLCPAGTDRNDCQVVVPPPPPQTYCCDAYGRKWCPMLVQLPLGSVCQCAGVPGFGNVCP